MPTPTMLPTTRAVADASPRLPPRDGAFSTPGSERDGAAGAGASRWSPEGGRCVAAMTDLARTGFYDGVAPYGDRSTAIEAPNREKPAMTGRFPAVPTPKAFALIRSGNARLFAERPWQCSKASKVTGSAPP